jgi:hypothetical protein
VRRGRLTLREVRMSISSTNIPKAEWSNFLRTFSKRHQGWLVQLETHDRVTGERVISPEMLLQSIELDLEDPNNSRINVSVQFDNKVVKHILFLPSELCENSLGNSRQVWLRVETVNTETTVRLRPASFDSK